MNDGAQALVVIAGRYVLGDVIGRGGAATVHLGKGVGTGRRGVVAIKRLHPHLAADPTFLAMMLDEARLLSRVRHENVTGTLDVVMEAGELYIVMEYVHGVTLGALLAAAHRKKERAPVPVACAIARDALLGLHAAHEARGSNGEPLGMVHRDVSPQNLLVAESGVLKVVDFGIAKAEGRVGHTMDGSIKGKLGYMPPEQLFGEALDRRADVYAAGVVLWETLVGERLFAGDDGGPALVKSLVSHVAPPSEHAPGIGEELDRVVLRALAHDRDLRFPTAQGMADALCEAQAPASRADVAAWVRSLCAEVLDERGARLFVFDRASRDLIRDLPRPRDSLVSLDTASAQRGRGRTWAISIAAALCAAAGGAAAVVLGGPPSSTATAGPEPTGTISLPASAPDPNAAAASAPTITVTASPATDPTPELPPTTSATATSAIATPSAIATSTAAASSPDPASAPTPARTGRPAPATKPPPGAKACDPPFTIDAQGHKRYKRECLR